MTIRMEGTAVRVSSTTATTTFPEICTPAVLRRGNHMRIAAKGLWQHIGVGEFEHFRPPQVATARP